AIFVGHEFERKGLPIAMEAVRDAPDVVLVVVGGSPDMIADASGQAARMGIADRVRFVGRQADPVPRLHAADVLVLPSAYEANALVVLEALACGLPVIATPVGFAPDIIVDGHNGYLVERDPAAVASRLSAFAASDRQPWMRHARETAERFAWPSVAQRYLDLVGDIAREKEAR
ncbi:MAG TPA: glycosyltransferase, partial [Pengzhenrongella sp.]